MICAWYPARILSLHTCPSDEDILYGIVKAMPHVQYAGYIAGGILIATSTVFFYHGYFSTPSTTAATQKRSNLIVMPSFGRGSAGATAYLRF